MKFNEGRNENPVTETQVMKYTTNLVSCAYVCYYDETHSKLNSCMKFYRPQKQQEKQLKLFTDTEAAATKATTKGFQLRLSG